MTYPFDTSYMLLFNKKLHVLKTLVNEEVGESGQMPLSKKKKKTQHFASFPKIIKEMPLF